MIVSECLCGALARISTETDLVVVGHVFELDRPTNTVHLAQLMLPGLTVLRRGQRDPAPAGPAPSRAERRALLWPDPSAPELTAEWAHLDPRPLTLVLADGTWPQARRAVRREPALANLPRLRLPDGPPTRFWLRRQRRTDQHLCTLEAIARALGIIEGHHVEAQLLAGLDLFVHRTLKSRGRLNGPQAHPLAHRPGGLNRAREDR